MTEIDIDIETYSDIDLKKAGVYQYVQSPEFDILMAAYSIDRGPTQIALTREEILAIPGLTDGATIKFAHNAQFERVCFSRYVGLDVGEFLDPEEWDCTMALAAEWGYPRSLDQLAKALGAEEKDSAGTRLINFFCKPDRKGNRRKPEDYPEEWQEFINYCIQDVDTLKDIRLRLQSWPNEAERRLYVADQRINDRGMPVDVDMAEAAVDAADTNRMEQELELMSISGIRNPGSGPQMIAWLQENGVQVDNMRADTVKTLLEGELPSPEVRRVLELRKELALVASKKYTAALDRVNEDNRLRGAFQFYGAHTGRWAGRGVQLQNLPSASLTDDMTKIDDVVAGAVLDLKMGAGASAHTLKALVRSMFVGPFTVVDYSAIEARVVAWLAAEDWALKAFTHGRDIYVETAERMGGLTRKEGKVAVLALGYNGGINSLAVMGAEGDKKHLQFLVDQWRAANPNIVSLWREMEVAFRKGDMHVGEKLYIEKDGKDRLMWLPSGRALMYHDLKGRWTQNRWGNRQQVISFADPKKLGLRTDTYGGRLVENATQAVARDVLSAALVRLEDAGMNPVGHVHDEALVLSEDLSRVEQLMVQKPEWADGLPIDAEGFVAPRYRKD